MSAEILYLVCT